LNRSEALFAASECRAKAKRMRDLATLVTDGAANAALHAKAGELEQEAQLLDARADALEW